MQEWQLNLQLKVEVYIFGEVTTTAKVNYKAIALRTLIDIGYLDDFNVHINISEQSLDIAFGVNERYNHEQGAGDQGMMYGYATDETEEGVPLGLLVAHNIAKRYKKLRKNKYFHLFAPDGKCQVSVVYEDDKPLYISTVIVSAQAKRYVDPKELEVIIKTEMLEPLIGDLEGINVLVNPTGEFIIGGPEADSGLTGRKIIVDTYGGFSHHGGGAFSGKDVSKVDRSGAYYARYVAKAFVKAGLCKRCEIGVAYSIGIAQPVSLYLDTFGTGVMNDESLLYLLKCYFDFRPSNIRDELKLDEVKFKELTTFGHMGRTDLNAGNMSIKTNDLRHEQTKRTPEVL